MALSIGGVAVVVPKASDDIRKVMSEVGKQFKIDEAVIKHFLDVICVESLQDFAGLFTDPADVKAVIEQVEALDPPKRLIQSSRVRQAWEGIVKAQSTAEVQRQRGDDDPDLDRLLGREDLDDINKMFYRRYHIHFGASEMPSDAVVSRISRELDRRLLTLRDVWRVTVLAQQQMGDKRRTDLTPAVSVVQDDLEPIPKGNRTLGKYLDLLWSLLIGYARAGVKPRPDAPSEPEDFGSSSVDYVLVPLDVCLKYHRRAQAFALSLPPAVALETLRARDEAERRVWMEKFRASKATLGQIMDDVFDKREGRWTTAPPEAAAHQPKRARAVDDAEETPTGASRFCPEWNRGQCSKNCPKGLEHRCNVIKPNGKPCGFANHRAAMCQHKQKGGR